MRGNMNILHITDLHFTLDKQSGAVLFPKKRWKKLISLVELRSKDEPIDMIAVTGDLTSHGEEAENLFCSGNIRKKERSQGKSFYCNAAV